MKHGYSRPLMLAALLGAFGCSAPPDQSIIVGSARAPGTSCDFTDATIYVESGALDLSVPQLYQSYYQPFSWQNDLENISVTVNSQITTETPNTFIATTIKDNYVMVGGTNPPNGLVSISAAILPGAPFNENSVGVYLLTSQAVAAICGAPTATDNCPGFTGGPETLLVTFQIAGALVGGGAAQTNPITYPLTLFKGGNVAPNGQLGCVTGTPQTTSCGIPGRDIPYCP